MFTAALDTSTLWPSLRRDFLLCLAVEGLYRPVWSERTLEELEYCERRKLIQRGTHEQSAADRARHLIARMREAFDDALVPETSTRIVAPAGLPDPNDEHVLAAAFAAGAGVIVTDNVRDFPATLLPPGIVVVRPAAFAADTVSVDPARAVSAVAAMAARRSGTPIEEVLAGLESRYAMGEACVLMREVM